MLSSRSHNLASSTTTEDIFPSLSTRNIALKTPARSLKHGRAVHDENSIYGHPRTAGLTGRKNNNVLFTTPAINGPLQSRLKTDKALRTASKSTALTEITNQTPFTTTHLPFTPGPVSLKHSKAFAVFNDDLVAPSVRRISSTRKKSRLPRSASKSFETPETRGSHWDVSDASIEASMIEDTSIMEEDYDDVEYAPPTAIEHKYDPGFDMPDYKEVGAVLMSLFRQTAIPEDYDMVADFDDVALLNEIGPLVLEKIELPDIPPDDIFPFMVELKGDQSSTAGTQPLKAVRPAVVASRPVSTGLEMPRLPSRISSVSSTSKPLPSKPLAKPLADRTTTVTHTRIPSLSKPASAQAHPPTTQTAKPTFHSRATSMTHARMTGVSSGTTSAHIRTTSVPFRTTGTMHSRTTSIPSRATTVSDPIGRSISARGRRVGGRPQKTNVPDDTVLSLLTGFADEVLGEEFLFKL